MADVILNCPHCGEGMTVSEYVDVSQLSCTSCGERMQLPQMQSQEKRRPTITKRRPYEPPPEEETDEERTPNTVVAARENMKSRPKRSSETFKFTMYSWLLFLVIGAVAWFVRHSGSNEDALVTGGLFLCGCLNLAIVLLAFKDDVFQGMLCLFIPGYFLYYLLFVSDSFFVRALIAGVFVGFGLDYATWVYENFRHALGSFSSFVNSGGGAIQ